MTKRFARVAPALVLAAWQFPLSAQSSAPQTPQSSSWADEIVKKEGYVTPPAEVADAVLAPSHLNVTLASASPDKKWFRTRWPRQRRTTVLAADEALSRSARPASTAVSLSARGSRSGVEGDAARPVGAVAGLARQVREEPAEAGAREKTITDSASR